MGKLGKWARRATAWRLERCGWVIIRYPSTAVHWIMDTYSVPTGYGTHHGPDLAAVARQLILLAAWHLAVAAEASSHRAIDSPRSCVGETTKAGGLQSAALMAPAHAAHQAAPDARSKPHHTVHPLPAAHLDGTCSCLERQAGTRIPYGILGAQSHTRPGCLGAVGSDQSCMPS